MSRLLKKLRDWALELKKWLELIAWLLAGVGLPAWQVSKYWEATDTELPVRIRPLALGILAIITALIVLVWSSANKDKRISELISVIPVEQERRPEIEERLLALIWHHTVQLEFFVRTHDKPMKEDIRTIEYHLECLQSVKYVAKGSDKYYRLTQLGKDYVFTHKLHQTINSAASDVNA
jgi:hypothetical protein